MGRNSSGVRGGGGSLRSAARAAQRAFQSQGVTDYFNGSNSPAARRAYQNYQTKLNQFQQAWTANGNGQPAFGDWSGAMNQVANGEIL